METDEIEHVGENGDIFVHRLKDLTDEEKQRLQAQNSRIIPEAKATRLEKEAKRHWDIFTRGMRPNSSKTGIGPHVSFKSL